MPPLSRIHEILIIPAAGHGGPGCYSRGHTVDAYAEVDLVDHYVRSLIDELDQSSIRHRLVPTRRAPGTSDEDRYDMAGVNVLPVVCAIGWDASINKVAAANTSTVRFSPDIPTTLASGLVDAMAHWGALYVHGHKRSTPVQSATVRGLILEPFKINGPNANQYAARLDALGRDIGRFLADYCVGRDTGTAVRAPSLLRRIQ